MTALGKILVFMNLAFSMLTGGLIVMVFLTRTNWKERHDAMGVQLQTFVAQARSEIDSVNAAKLSAESKATQAETALAAKVTELEDLTTKLQTANDDIAKLKTKSTSDSLLTAGSTANLETIKKERDALKADLSKLQVSLEESIAAGAKDREKAVGAEQKFNAMKQRAEELLTKLTIAEEALANVKRGVVVAGAGQPAAPAQAMRGSVKAVDGNLLTVSIGSDNGLREGNSLKVFRLEPEAAYLGTLRVSAVRAKEAVGSFEPAAGAKKMAVKAGDQVADKIQ